jgi:hypothetical protein
MSTSQSVGRYDVRSIGPSQNTSQSRLNIVFDSNEKHLNNFDVLKNQSAITSPTNLKRLNSGGISGPISELGAAVNLRKKSNYVLF